MRQSATLAQFVDQYAETRDLAGGTVEQLRYAVGCLDRWSRRNVRVDQLEDKRINRWLEWMLVRYARPTVKGRRGAILTLWRAAFDAGLTRRLPKRIKPIRLEASIPEAWTLRETAAALAACNRLEGLFPCGVKRKALLRAYVLAGWYTGLRECDLLALSSAKVRTNTFMLLQIKTGVPILCRLPADAWKAIQATVPHERQRVFPLSRKTLRYWWLKILDDAGLNGSPKWLRRSGATAVEVARPGSAMAYLGHKTPGLAYRHYVDARQVNSRRPKPPRLGR